MPAKYNTRPHSPSLAAILFCLILSACTGLPDGIEPVANFNVDAYQGRWYEIARLDHSFERGQSNVTATYTIREDGAVSVFNRGYEEGKDIWREATGIARLSGAENVGHLEVSFFRPFYASYVIFELADDGSYAFVTGYNRDYLWLLSRTPSVGDELKDSFVQKVSALGFASEALIWVDQSRN